MTEQLVAIVVNQDRVAGETAAPGIARQPLMTAASNAQASVRLDRYTLAVGAQLALNVAARNLVWFQVLAGAISLSAAGRSEALTDAQVCLLPPGCMCRIETTSGAVLLVAEVPDADRFDPAIAAGGLELRIVDWTREPVLDSEHDARKRIYLATPKLFGTKAIKGEMIIYPPGTQAANHHHEGAEHFMFVLSGAGTAWANEQPFEVRAGDLIWYANRERHYLRSHCAAELRFVEFFVPGTYRTTWAPGAMVCTWSPTGRDIRCEPAAREIGHHRSDAGLPADV